MGRLTDFIEYLDGRRKVVKEVETQLLALQEKYETFFAEVSRIREQEYAQLEAHLLADRGRLPAELNAALDEALVEAKREMDEKIAELEEKRDAFKAEAEQARDASEYRERMVRRRNVKLDRKEEALKERSAALLSEIDDHNRRIREMGRGFGFFRNLFRMRKLAKSCRALQDEQDDLAAQIDKLRHTWEEEEADALEEEKAKQGEWVEASTEAAAVQAKIDYLRSARSRIVQRSALEKVLFARMPTLPEPTAADPPCTRCGRPNPAVSHFCQICGLRLKEDRPDAEGSLEEVAELNAHHKRFQGGVQACQELIGLVRGLDSGIAAFTESVQDMHDSEKRHPLPKLQIDVPPTSVEYGALFDELKANVTAQDLSLHPADFAEQVKTFVDTVFTEDRIKLYFETMGKELSIQATAQW